MKAIPKNLINAGFLLIWIIAGTAQDGMGKDITLETCSYDKMNAAIQTVKAGDGGVVYLPPCDVSFADTDGKDRGLKLPPGVSIIGSGKGKTILRDTGIYNGSDYGVGRCGDGTSRISGLSVVNDFESQNYVWEMRKIEGLRIDHCAFEGRFSTFMKITMAPGNDNYFLMDHCDLNLFTSYGLYTHHDNSYSEDYKSLLGSNQKSTVFVEDCVFKGRYDHLMDGRSGAHYVFRYNRVVYDSDGGSGPIEGHGPTDPNWEELNAGTNCMEIYHNEIMNPSSIPFGEGASGVLIRSGSAVVFNNRIGYKRWGVALAIEGSPYRWDRHDGRSPAGAPYPAGYPAYHQPHGIWIWGNQWTSLATPVGIVWDPDGNVAENYLVENRDYFLRQPSESADGFAYSPYPYPHPLASGEAYPENDPDPDAHTDTHPGTDNGSDTEAGTDPGPIPGENLGSGCFIAGILSDNLSCMFSVMPGLTRHPDR